MENNQNGLGYKKAVFSTLLCARQPAGDPLFGANILIEHIYLTILQLNKTKEIYIIYIIILCIRGINCNSS